MKETTMKEFISSISFERNIRQKIDVLENTLLNWTEDEREIIDSINELKEMIWEQKILF